MSIRGGGIRPAWNQKKMKAKQQEQSEAHKFGRGAGARVADSDQSFKGHKNNTRTRAPQSRKAKEPKKNTPWITDRDLQDLSVYMGFDVGNALEDVKKEFTNLGAALGGLFDSPAKNTSSPHEAAATSDTTPPVPKGTNKNGLSETPAYTNLTPKEKKLFDHFNQPPPHNDNKTIANNG